MTITISINEDNDTFKKYVPLETTPSFPTPTRNMKHLALVIGAVSQPPMFYNFQRRTDGMVGSAGSNNKILAVSSAFPLVFEDHDFTLLGSQDPYHASRTLSLVIDLMRKNLLNVDHDGTPMTPEDVLKFEAA